MRKSNLVLCPNLLPDDDLPISLNSFQSSSNVSMSLYRGSNLGPPGIAIFSALAVKNEFCCRGIWNCRRVGQKVVYDLVDRDWP